MALRLAKQWRKNGQRIRKLKYYHYCFITAHSLNSEATAVLVRSIVLMSTPGQLGQRSSARSHLPSLSVNATPETYCETFYLRYIVLDRAVHRSLRSQHLASKKTLRRWHQAIVCVLLFSRSLTLVSFIPTYSMSSTTPEKQDLDRVLKQYDKISTSFSEDGLDLAAIANVRCDKVFATYGHANQLARNAPKVVKSISIMQAQLYHQ